tara:strand:+ start:1444 stop:1917 length:474 start_codon:yes stop_codon:yes gene_type:complete
MVDANEQEFGNQASKVRFQDDTGQLKNSDGEAVIEITDDRLASIVGANKLVYRPDFSEQSSGTLSGLTNAISGKTIFLTASSSTVIQLPELEDTDKGVQVVIANVHTADITGAVTVAGSDKFYDNSNTSGTTSAQDIAAMKAKTFICWGHEKWLVVG